MLSKTDFFYEFCDGFILGGDILPVLLGINSELYFDGDLYRVHSYYTHEDEDGEEILIKVVCNRVAQGSNLHSQIERDLKLRSLIN